MVRLRAVRGRERAALQAVRWNGRRVTSKKGGRRGAEEEEEEGKRTRVRCGGVSPPSVLSPPL